MSKQITDKIEISSNAKELSTLRQWIGDFVAQSPDFKEQAKFVVLAVDEAATNVILHAYRGEPDHKIIVRAVMENSNLQIVLRDTGRPFDPESVPKPHVDKVGKSRKTGGFGIYLMKKVMDKVDYSFKKGQYNELRLIKYARPPARKAAMAKSDDS